MAAFEEIDVHGLTKDQAKTAIDARLKKCKGDVYILKVIHGFHGGTAIRDFVRAHYKNHEKVLRVSVGLNQGETDLILKEL